MNDEQRKAAVEKVAISLLGRVLGLTFEEAQACWLADNGSCAKHLWLGEARVALASVHHFELVEAVEAAQGLLAVLCDGNHDVTPNCDFDTAVLRQTLDALKEAR